MSIDISTNFQLDLLKFKFQKLCWEKQQQVSKGMSVLKPSSCVFLNAERQALSGITTY